jgi:flagellar basal-body rod protein FlgF
VPGGRTRVFAVDATIGNDYSQGPMLHTGRALDVAVAGRGWIAVQAADGNEAYTRAGSFELDANGLLQTRTGLPVLSDGGGPINVPADVRVTISEDGTVSAIPTTGAQVPAIIGRIKLVNPEDAEMTRGGDGLFRARSGEAAADDTVRLQPNTLEGSNVNAVEAMVTMIAVARQFEMQMKMISSADDNARQANRLLAHNG